MRKRGALSRGMTVIASAVLGLGMLVLTGSPALAANTQYAPPNRPGPALSVPGAQLAAALHCSGDFRSGDLEPVLLSPGTGVTPEQNFSWNYERAFTAQHRPWCAVTMPDHTLGDIQTAGEYLVYAIRTESAMAHRKIAVLGHSQGGMSMRWALRFWPDTRAMVDDVIGMAGDNHGTTALPACKPDLTKCPPADWQQIAGSHYLEALNSYAETWPGISYTEIFTHTDQTVQPSYPDAAASSALHTGAGQVTNVATQDVCANDVDEHLLIGTVDPVTYALVVDALDHPGPARPSRIDHAVCLRQYQPGVDPADAQNYLQALAVAPGLLAVYAPDVNLVGAPEVSAEPPLRCYLYATGCRGQTHT